MNNEIRNSKHEVRNNNKGQKKCSKQRNGTSYGFDPEVSNLFRISKFEFRIYGWI